MPKNVFSSVRSGIFRPYGALRFLERVFYKDAAPDGAVKKAEEERRSLRH
jgi:hypothetical protein